MTKEVHSVIHFKRHRQLGFAYKICSETNGDKILHPRVREELGLCKLYRVRENCPKQPESVRIVLGSSTTKGNFLVSALEY